MMKVRGVGGAQPTGRGWGLHGAPLEGERASGRCAAYRAAFDMKEVEGRGLLFSRELGSFYRRIFGGKLENWSEKYITNPSRQPQPHAHKHVRALDH